MYEPNLVVPGWMTITKIWVAIAKISSINQVLMPEIHTSYLVFSVNA
ncbi:hypothetical protein OGM63_00260 [Plectonema radiosum NIES-515]|uniref:Uncharacterized protein n=1 Tax=Plectonema radiosum NIES-515 TaxID=2986073 RepID=A0ABT3AS68_9CYAN|nr:hypothetical protein [Plectonema radiosum]MCV3211971.1 hypothetical protein [Plectonema radiosum NIES-515]